VQAVKEKTNNIKLHFAGKWQESSKLQAVMQQQYGLNDCALEAHIEGICCILSQLISLSHNTIVKSFLVENMTARYHHYVPECNL
jgi:hypothetical protein